jgi:hypothetical protein
MVASNIRLTHASSGRVVSFGMGVQSGRRDLEVTDF